MSLPTDVETHRDWHLETPLEVSSSQRVLYVHQGEIAYGIPEKDYDCVGSDDATTCIILLCDTWPLDSCWCHIWTHSNVHVFTII